MPNVTKTKVDDTIAVQVATMALGALAGNLSLGRVADRNWEPMFAQQGETVQVPLRGALTANDKAADADVTYQAPDTTNVQITLDNHKEISLLFEDVAKAFSNQDIVQGYAEDAAIVLAEAIEVAGFVAAHAGFTTIADLGAAGVGIDHANMIAARKNLRDQKVPRSSPIYMFMSTTGVSDIFQLPEYRDASQTGSSEIAENAPAEFSKYGVNFIESQYVQTVGGAIHNLYLSPKQGLALATRPLPLPSSGVVEAEVITGVPEADTGNLGLRVIRAYNAAKLGEQLTLDVLYGWKVIRGAFGGFYLR
jgi:hypothetical protein